MSRPIMAVVPLALGIILVSAQFAPAQISMGNFTTARDRVFNNPSVSPYLQLLSQDDSYGVPNYFTRVKPRLEADQRSQRQQMQLNRVQAQASRTRRELNRSQSSAGIYPTGHPTRFGNYSHYYLFQPR